MSALPALLALLALLSTVAAQACPPANTTCTDVVVDMVMSFSEDPEIAAAQSVKDELLSVFQNNDANRFGIAATDLNYNAVVGRSAIIKITSNNYQVDSFVDYLESLESDGKFVSVYNLFSASATSKFVVPSDEDSSSTILGFEPLYVYAAGGVVLLILWVLLFCCIRRCARRSPQSQQARAQEWRKVLETSKSNSIIDASATAQLFASNKALSRSFNNSLTSAASTAPLVFDRSGMDDWDDDLETEDSMMTSAPVPNLQILNTGDAEVDIDGYGFGFGAVDAAPGIQLDNLGETSDQPTSKLNLSSSNEVLESSADTGVTLNFGAAASASSSSDSGIRQPAEWVPEPYDGVDTQETYEDVDLAPASAAQETYEDVNIPPAPAAAQETYEDVDIAPSTPARSAGQAANYEDIDIGTPTRSQQQRMAAAEAAAAALKAEEEAAAAREEEKIPPKKWTSIECITWLRHNGFQDFQDTFYNNGFEGRHLVALSVESFGGTKAHTPDRCRELVAAIRQLKAVGYWIPPKKETEEESSASVTPAIPPIGVPLSQAPPALPPVNKSMRRRVSDGPRPRLASDTGSRGRKNSNASSHRDQRAGSDASSVAPTSSSGVADEMMENARINYLLSLDLNRETSERLLRNGRTDDGTYLVRKSQSASGTYVLSMVSKGKVHHFPITCREFDGMYVTQLGHKFKSLEDLVAHFKTHSKDGIPCRLKQACRDYDHLIAPPEQKRAGSPTPSEKSGDYEAITPTTKQMADFRRMSKEKIRYENQSIIDQQGGESYGVAESTPLDGDDETYNHLPPRS
eukprot:m.297478 g.297478  ORF g.297478 m.297478 type:complete len:803 (-) comp13619_c0_seq1:241-2649(-)